MHIQLKSETPEQHRTTNLIGVDFGRREIAKTSTDKGWDGEQITKIRDKFARVRSSLQRKASRHSPAFEKQERTRLLKAQGLLAVERDRFCNGYREEKEDFNNG